MRLNLPQDVPHDLEVPRERKPETSLELSPVERRLERLAEQAGHPRRLDIPTSERRQRAPEQDRDLRPSHSIPHDQRPQRQTIPSQAIGLSLRDEEIKLLADVGRFRVIATRDLAEIIYDNRPSRLDRDLAFLRQHGLVQVDSVQARRDGRRGQGEHIEVVTLTRAGRDLARQTSGLPQDQKLYAGLVKPREVEHDSQIYRAYLKEAERIERDGGKNLRVQLDFELKSQIQKAIYAERKAAPERDLDEIKQQVAEQFDLPFVNNGIQISDARIEYDRGQGIGSGHQDIEVLTAAYSAGIAQSQLAAKHCSNPTVFDKTVAPTVHHCAVSLPLSIAPKE